MNLLQNNDQSIDVYIKKDNVDINTTTLLSATYKLYLSDRNTVILEKSLLDMMVKDNKLTIKISANDSSNLRGRYYHELSIVDANNERSTVFKQTLIFEPTEN